MRKIKLGIQLGHDVAALPNSSPMKPQTGTNGELDLTKKVYFAIKEIIDSRYSDIIELYYDDARCLNAAGMDYYFCPHFDGATNPSYDGGFVDCNPESLTKDKDWAFAQTLADNYFGPMGIRFAPEHRTVNSTYYYAFNFTGDQTIQTIMELGTLTNASDRAKCQDYKKIAQLIVNGLVAYFTKEDANFKEYLKGQAAQSCETTLGIVRKQLQEAKDAFTKLQQDTKKQLADKDTECQYKIHNEIEKMKADIISYISEYVEIIK